ncbi:DMT family transporter [Eubacterium sp. 1001713B170207_170306_E7]|uniref:DMT family transporter n=1 Tax=Eubacterium sp. 1001713B170207_170306_E7 TaxID=2787097 RepID=UPI00189B5729|nr:DMT family transporter [Eubacterium sp. 1001713B170207_170306_E7]
MRNSKNFIYGSFIILQCMFWGLGNPVAKIGLETISPFYCLALRFLLAFIVFYGLFYKKIKAQINKNNVKDAVVISIFNAAAFIFSTLALMYSSATIAGFLMALAVIFTPFMSFVVLGKKFRKRTLLFVGLVVLGLYFLCGSQGSFSFGVGEVLALLSSVSYAANITYSSKHVTNIGPEVLSTIQAGVAAAICFFFAFLLEDGQMLGQVGPAGWFAVVYLALGCTVIAYLLQNVALKHLSAVFVSLALCSEPIFTAFFSFFLLGERLTLSGGFGAALVMASIVLASLFNGE